MRRKAPVLALMLARGLAAQDAGTLRQETSIEPLLRLLETPVISASRMLQAPVNAPSRVIVVTADEIRLRGYTDLEEILHDLPGFDFNKVMGVEWSTIYMRGFRSSNSDRFLFIWDGVIQNDIWKQSNWISRQYPMSEIRRIEVSYGPSSLLYGANAMSGIINVILRKDEELPQAQARIQTGAFRTRSVEAGFRLNSGNWGFHFLGRSYRSDGFDLNGKYWTDNAGRKRYYNLTIPGDLAPTTDPAYALVLVDGLPTWLHNGQLRVMDGRYEKSDNNWFIQSGITYKAFRLEAFGWRNEESQGPWYTAQNKLQSPWTPTGNAIRFSHEAQLTDAVSGKSYAQMRTSGIEGDTSYGLRFQTRFTSDPNNPGDLKVYRMDPTLFSKIFNREYRLGYQIDYSGEPWLSAIAGAEYTTTKIREDYSIRNTDQEPWKASPQHEERNAALFGNAQIRPSESFSLAAGARYDYNSHAGERGGFGSLGTFRVAGIFNPDQAQYVKVIFAQAYQAPPPFQKFSTAPSIRDLPAPGLRPEKLDSIELVYGYSRNRRWRLDLSLYQHLVDGFITLVTVPFPANPSGTTTQYANLGGVRIRGAELEMRADLGRGWRLYGNASASRARDSQTGRRVGDIAPWKANLGLDARPWYHFGLSLRTHFVSRRDTVNWDSSSIYSVRQVASYFTMDATLTWFEPLPGFDLHLNLYNLFDRVYYDPGPRSADGKTYNAAILQQPFRGLLGLRYRF